MTTDKIQPRDLFWDHTFLDDWAAAFTPGLQRSAGGRHFDAYAAVRWAHAPSWSELWGSLRGMLAGSSASKSQIALTAWALREHGGWEYLEDQLREQTVILSGTPHMGEPPWQPRLIIQPWDPEVHPPVGGILKVPPVPHPLRGPAAFQVKAWSGWDHQHHFILSWRPHPDLPGSDLTPLSRGQIPDPQGWIPGWQNPPWSPRVYGQVSSL